MKSLKKEVEAKKENSISFKFMWIDSSKHKKWNDKFSVDGEQSTAIRVLNAGKRKRFLPVEGEYNRKNLLTSLEKILTGDARFVNIRENLPEFAADL